MGLVTEHFVKLIQRQVDEHGIVVWSDPEGVYASLAAGLTLPQTHVARYNGSFLALRREVDDLLNQVRNETPPRLVVYFPHDRSAAGHALDEFTVGDVVMQPGGRSLLLNTNLEVIARHALKPVLTPDKVESLCEQVRKRQITSLDELDRLAEQGVLAGGGALALIFDAGQPSDIALEFLTNPGHDNELTARSITPQLATLLSETFGADLPRDETPEGLRRRLQNHLLITEFRNSLLGDPPSALATVQYPESPAREACAQLVRAWRNRRDLQAQYAEAARRVEADYGLSTLSIGEPDLRRVETFPFVEERLQTGVETGLLQYITAEHVELAEARQAAFWAEQNPIIRGRWALIAAAGRLLSMAERIGQALKTDPPATAADYITRYTEGDQPWCLLDTHHRTLERLAQNFDLDPYGAHASLEQLLAHARHQYSVAVDALARRFVSALAEARFTLGGLLYQTEIFSRCVAPAQASGKTAYVLVDALRYEMARDLAASLNKHWQVELTPAVGTPPTITPVGMAALLPGAERGLTLVAAGRGVAAEIGGHVFEDRQDRVRFLAEQIENFCEIKLDALAPAKKAAREKIKAADFTLVTSQEIDLMGEGDNLSQAREFMDSALSKLARAFRVLADLGVQRIIVAADHGYLFGEELESDRTLPAPGGQTVDLHRRVWVGRGGQSHDEVLRLSARDLNLGGDLELTTPYGLACFAAPGGRAYLHGGLSLQELIIPVMTIQPAPAPVTAQIEWTLSPGSARLTTRFFSVVVGGRAIGMFDLTPPRIRVEAQARGKPVSIPVSASYGFQEATGEVEMRPRPDVAGELDPNTITVMIADEIEQKTVSIVLIDAQTEQTLKKLEVDVAIAL